MDYDMHIAYREAGDMDGALFHHPFTSDNTGYAVDQAIIKLRSAANLAYGKGCNRMHDDPDGCEYGLVLLWETASTLRYLGHRYGGHWKHLSDHPDPKVRHAFDDIGQMLEALEDIAHKARHARSRAAGRVCDEIDDELDSRYDAERQRRYDQLEARRQAAAKQATATAARAEALQAEGRTADAWVCWDHAAEIACEADQTASEEYRRRADDLAESLTDDQNFDRQDVLPTDDIAWRRSIL